MPSSTDLDPATLAALRALDRDGSLMPRLAAAFERTLAQQQPRLQAARAEPPDLQAQRQAMHVLRSAARQLGALALAERCGRLEQAGAGAPGGPALPAEWDAFDLELAGLRHALAGWTLAA